MTQRSFGNLCYLATPFTNYKNGDIEAAFNDACSIASRLIVIGFKLFSPIAHGHAIARAGNLDPLDREMWLEFDEAMMRVCDVLIVAHMEGWEESKGIAHEVAYFENAGRPIFDLDPVSLAMMRRREKVASS